MGSENRGATSRAIVMRLAIRSYYSIDGNGAGGSLHIVLDDNNLEDEHIQFCLEQAEQKADREGSAIAREMLTMSMAEREFAVKADLYELLPDLECTYCERTAVCLSDNGHVCSVHAENPPKESAAAGVK